MKKHIVSIFTLAALTITTLSCKEKAKEATTTDAEAVAAVDETTSELYQADSSKSIIDWQGFKPAGSHSGTVNIKEGEFSINDNNIESGSFVINMDSIIVEDIPEEDEGNAKLLGHLKSPDFFNVEAHNAASFKITGSTMSEGKTMLSGNLTIKGIEQNITFPVSLTNTEKGLTLESETFTIDRTKWDIKFKSKSFFGDLGDKFINDEIELKFVIKANKA